MKRKKKNQFLFTQRKKKCRKKNTYHGFGICSGKWPLYRIHFHLYICNMHSEFLCVEFFHSYLNKLCNQNTYVLPICMRINYLYYPFSDTALLYVYYPVPVDLCALVSFVLLFSISAYSYNNHAFNAS